MPLLPVALDVSGVPCLVVGGGPVGARKAASLLNCGAAVTLISPVLCDEARGLIERLKYLPRPWHSGDAAGFQLIWACTPSREVNEAIAAEARASNIWCGVSGAGAGGQIHGMAEVRRGDICVAIATGGASPALSKHLKSRVEEAVGEEYEVLLGWMGQARGELKARLATSSERAIIWRAVLESDVLDLLRGGEVEAARARFESIVGGL